MFGNFDMECLEGAGEGCLCPFEGVWDGVGVRVGMGEGLMCCCCCCGGGGGGSGGGAIGF